MENSQYRLNNQYNLTLANMSQIIPVWPLSCSTLSMLAEYVIGKQSVLPEVLNFKIYILHIKQKATKWAMPWDYGTFCPP